MDLQQRRDDADAIYAWIIASIAERGGTARRTGRITWEGPVNDDQRAVTAMRALVLAGRCTLDTETGAPFGYVYLVPVIPDPGWPPMGGNRTDSRVCGCAPCPHGLRWCTHFPLWASCTWCWVLRQYLG